MDNLASLNIMHKQREIAHEIKNIERAGLEKLQNHKSKKVEEWEQVLRDEDQQKQFRRDAPELKTLDFAGGLKVIVPKSRRLLKEVAVSQDILPSSKNSDTSSPRVVIHAEPLIRRCGLTKN